MKRKHLVFLFLFFSGISFFGYMVNGKSEGDEIKKTINNGIDNVSDAAKNGGFVVAEKTKKASIDLFQSAKEKGMEMLEENVFSPAQDLAENCLEKAVYIGASALPSEKVKYILETIVGDVCSSQ